MENIYSKVDPNKLLHVIVRKEDLVKGRIEVVPTNNFIQCAILNMDEGKTFKPHKHIWKERTRNVIAQESWVVIEGSVRCVFYDIDDQIIAEPILYSGDASFTLEGGHTYFILEDNTLVYEYKTGPYEGQKLDKTFLNDEIL
jgi:cupin fold WbuC family metalloprotein